MKVKFVVPFFDFEPETDEVLQRSLVKERLYRLGQDRRAQTLPEVITPLASAKVCYLFPSALTLVAATARESFPWQRLQRDAENAQGETWACDLSQYLETVKYDSERSAYHFNGR
jgi:hypothetical protein